MIQFDLTPGDFIDRYSIASIKIDKGVGVDIRRYVDAFGKLSADDQTKCNDAFHRLRAVNLSLWNVEDSIRDEMARNETRRGWNDHTISHFAQQVVYLNDQRAKIKRELDTSLGHEYDRKVYGGAKGYEI